MNSFYFYVFFPAILACCVAVAFTSKIPLIARVAVLLCAGGYWYGGLAATTALLACAAGAGYVFSRSPVAESTLAAPRQISLAMLLTIVSIVSISTGLAVANFNFRYGNNPRIHFNVSGFLGSNAQYVLLTLIAILIAFRARLTARLLLFLFSLFLTAIASEFFARRGLRLGVPISIFQVRFALQYGFVLCLRLAVLVLPLIFIRDVLHFQLRRTPVINGEPTANASVREAPA